MKKPNLLVVTPIIFLCLLFYEPCYSAALQNTQGTQSLKRFKNFRETRAQLLKVSAGSLPASAEKRRNIANYREALAMERAFIGDVFGAIEDFNVTTRLREIHTAKLDRHSLNLALAQIREAVAEDAISAIVRAAKGRQIVILNEAHHVPMHRAFAMKLARKLREIGYEYLACEAFRINDMAPLADNFVSERSSFYLAEPMFANFLNDAIQAGWQFVSYEPLSVMNLPPSERSRFRETDMAKNLVNRIFMDKPKAKVFIYAGYSHINEKPLSRADADGSKMAAQLKRMTGIDPLTIDQTTMYQHYESKTQTYLYKELLKKQPEQMPFVLRTQENTFLNFALSPGSADIQIIHPAYSVSPITGRADWLNILAGFIPREIPSELIPTNGSRLILAYRKDDPVGATPTDAVVVEAGKPTPMLMLPNGEFRYEVED